MRSISLRQEVQDAVRAEWQPFAERHPRLAEIIDQAMLVEQATVSLGDDPEFRDAMERAAAVGTAGQVLGELVRRFVRDWLGRLL